MVRQKKGLFIVLFSILLLPVVQQYIPFIKSGQLNGIFSIAPQAYFSWNKWWDGTYQEEKTRYINDNIGLRPDLIRTNNQVDYSLFKKAHSEWRILVGKNDCIYQDVYIYSYTGKDFIGYDSIYTTVRKLKAVQDTLERLGKTIVLIHAPSKAFYYPEYISDEYLKPSKRITNLDTYIKAGDSLGIHQVNFNGWFMAMKDTSKELLYPRAGFHWSVYGALLAADSLTRYIEHTRHISMLHLKWTTVEHTNKPRGLDDDLAKGLNLILPVVKETYTYPEVIYPKNDTTKAKPKVVYIGDSFFFGWRDSWYMDNVNSAWQIWYYNRLLLNSDHRQELPEHPVWEINWPDEINKTDCIVLMYTSRNLTALGDGFIERAYDYYFPKGNNK